MLRKLRIESLERRLLLAASTTWIGGSGDWDQASNWSNGVPAAGVTAAISPSSAATITIQSGESVAAGSLSVGSNATLNLPSVNSQLPTSNLLANGGFQSPTASGSSTRPGSWGYWGSTYLSTQYAYAGSQSIAIGGANSGVTQVFSITPGTSYTESAYAMMSAGNPLTGSIDAEIQFFFYNSSGTMLSQYGPPNQLVVLTSSSATGGPLSGSVGSQGWNFYHTTAVAPAGAATVQVQLAVYASTGTYGGAVYFDAAQFGPAALPASLAAGSISNSGTLVVGAADTVTVSGTFAQTSTGRLDVQLGGNAASGQYGSLTITGAATWAGTFQSDLVNGYVPATTDSFTPITYSSETGNFSSFSLPSGSGYQFAAAATFTNVVVSAAPSASVTTTVNAASTVHAAANLMGINSVWWDSNDTSSQTGQMTAAAGLDLYRFPGGSASDEYHFNVADNFNDGSAVTIPQFAQFIASAGASGLVTIDYGSGSPQEAAAELAYLLGSPSDTTSIGTGIEWLYGASAWTDVNWQTVGYWASLRAASPLATDDGLNFLRIAHPAPFSSINRWEVGNEEYGSWETDYHGTAGPGGASTGAQHDPQTYAAFAEQFAALAAVITRTAGLSISIGIDSGDPTGASDNNWTTNVLTDGKNLGFVPGFISDHSYMQAPGQENDATLLNATVTNSASVLDWSTRYAVYAGDLQSTLGSQASGVQVLATEFNSVYTNPGKQSTSLVNGLFVANSLGSLLDSGYSGAYLWDLRNSYESGNNASNSLYGWRTSGDYGVLSSDPSNPRASGDYVAYPSYYAMQLFSKFDLSGAEVVGAASSYGDLDVYAVIEPASDNDDLELLVVNTNPAAAITDQFAVAGFQPSGAAQVWQYGVAQDTAQSVSSTGASSLANSSTTLALSGATFSYSFPAYSMTVLDLKVKQTFTSVSISPSIAALSSLGTQQFTATALDQFGNALASPPTFSWSLSGAGLLSSSGLYTALYASGVATVTATAGGLNATGSVTLPGTAQLTATGAVAWSSAAWIGSVSGAATNQPGLRGVSGDTVAISGASGTSVALNGVSPSLAAITIGGGVSILPGSGGSLQLFASSGAANIASTGGSSTIGVPIALASNTAIAAAAAATLTIAQTISGSGSLTVNGSGTVKLAGADTYGGGTIITGGTLIIASAAGLLSGSNLTIGANAASYFEQNASIIAASTSQAVATVSFGAQGSTTNSPSNSATKRIVAPFPPSSDSATKRVRAPFPLQEEH